MTIYFLLLILSTYILTGNHCQANRMPCLYAVLLIKSFWNLLSILMKMIYCLPWSEQNWISLCIFSTWPSTCYIVGDQNPSQIARLTQSWVSIPAPGLYKSNLESEQIMWPPSTLASCLKNGNEKYPFYRVYVKTKWSNVFKAICRVAGT